MALTEEERHDIIHAVLDAIRAESSDITGLESVTSLSGIMSLPGLQGERLVLVPLSLLSKPATDAASVATEAAQSATEAATAAKSATAAATAATGLAESATASARSATDAATAAAAEYGATALLALRGATGRFGGFVTIDEEWLSAGDIDILSSEEAFAAERVMYNAQTGRFLVQDSAKIFFDRWDGSALYNHTVAGAGTQAFHDKVYIWGDVPYLYHSGMLVRVRERVVYLSAEEYEGLEAKDADTIYMIYEEDE